MAKSDVSAVACVFYAAGKCRKGASNTATPGLIYPTHNELIDGATLRQLTGKACPFSHEAAGPGPRDSGTRQQHDRPIVKKEDWDPSYTDRGRDAKRTAEHVPEDGFKRRRTLSPVMTTAGSHQLTRSSSGARIWQSQEETRYLEPNRMQSGYHDVARNVAARDLSRTNTQERMYGSEVLPARPSTGAKKRWDPDSKRLVDADPPPAATQSLLDRVQKSRSPDYPPPPPLGPHEPYRPQNANALGYNPGYTPNIALSARLEPAPLPYSSASSSFDPPYQVRSERYRSQLEARPTTPPRSIEVRKPEATTSKTQIIQPPPPQPMSSSSEKQASTELVEIKYELPWGSKAEAIRQSILAQSNKFIEKLAKETGTSVEVSRNRTAIFINGSRHCVDEAADKLSAHIKRLQPSWTPNIQRRSPAPKQASTAAPASLKSVENGQQAPHIPSLPASEEYGSVQRTGSASQGDHNNIATPLAVARIPPSDSYPSNHLHESPTFGTQSEAFLRSVIQDRLVGAKSKLPPKPAVTDLPSSLATSGLPDKPLIEAGMMVEPTSSAKGKQTVPITSETAARASRVDSRPPQEPTRDLPPSSSKSPLAKSHPPIPSSQHAVQAVAEPQHNMAAKAVNSTLGALQQHAPVTEAVLQGTSATAGKPLETSQELLRSTSHGGNSNHPSEGAPANHTSGFSSSKIRLPDDQDARELIRALDNYRDGRDLFPFGRLHMDKLLRLVALQEGPLKFAFAELERIIADAGQRGFM